MRNPGRKLLIWLAIAVLGWVAIAASFDASRRLDEDWTVAVLGVTGVILFPVGLVYMAWALALLRGQTKLRHGHRLLARWHVEAEEWQQFIAFDRIRAGSGSGLANDYRPEKQDHTRGVEVLIGETGLAIGDLYQVLRRGGLPALHGCYWLPAPADPQCLEFHVVYPRRAGPGTRLCVRVPIAASAHGAARQVFDHFEPMLRPRESIALRNPHRTMAVASTIAVAGGVASIWGFSTGNAANGAGIVALTTGVICVIVAVTAGAIAVVTLISSRRRAQR